MGLMFLSILCLLLRCFGLQKAEKWNKEFGKGISGRYTSSFAENDEKTQSDLLKLTERSSSSFLKRITRRKTSQKCFIAGSTVYCDGGLKFRSVGPVGRPGSPGLPGPQVGKGDKGFRGSPGRPGADGPQGERGIRGAKGVKGNKGPKGVKGDHGRVGPQGPPGIPSNCRIFPSRAHNCPRGETGPPGIKGSTGPEGKVGEKGDRGFTGNIGDKGSRGDPGMPGSIGLYGALRANGPCRKLQSQWVVPNLSPIGQLKTECVFREYLLSLQIEADKKNEKIRYNYKCCPFKASDVRMPIF